MNTVPLFDLEAMRRVDIRTVNTATLMEIKNVNIDPNLPFKEKATQYLRQIGNAYCFRCGDVAVKVKHSQTGKSLTDCMEGCFRSL